MTFSDIVSEIKSEMDPWAKIDVMISDTEGNIKYSDITSERFLNALSRFIKKRSPNFSVGDYYYIQNISGVMLFKTSINSMVILRTKKRVGILLFFMKILEKIGLKIELELGNYTKIQEVRARESDREFLSRKIPLFKIIASPRQNSPNWLKRLQEEYDKLNYLYRLRKDFSNFSIFKQSNSSRIFKCSFQGIIFNLRLSLHYPKVMPIADGFYYGQWFSPAGEHKNACLGILKNRWRNDGRYGIAHFIQLLGYYSSIAKARKLELNLKPPKAVNIHLY
ncbi:MAG: hypothetical protein GF329_21265 [Candidatus Lokiarchaeota archaeon]|nr:hypothetical protein [Candidatus Lokiarchaeota archaeon]